MPPKPSDATRALMLIENAISEKGDRTPIDTENYFWSENSSDPFFEVGWEKEG